MGRTLTASAGTITPMWRRDQAGNLIEVEPDQADYCNPAQGTRARFVLSGISEVFEMDGDFGRTENVRVEFLIEKVTSKEMKWCEGKRLTQLFTYKVGPKSNLGKFLGALRGREVQPGEQVDIDAFIGTSFVTSTTMSEKGYAGISTETIEAGSVRLSPYVAGGNGTATAISNGAGDADEDDPFTEAEDL